MVPKLTLYGATFDTIWCHLVTPYGVVPNSTSYGVKVDIDTMEFREYWPLAATLK